MTECHQSSICENKRIVYSETHTYSTTSFLGPILGYLHKSNIERHLSSWLAKSMETFRIRQFNNI